MKRLSSLVLTLYALSAVVLCLAVGIVLAQAPPFAAAMTRMDHGLVLDWLLAARAGASASKVLALWFVTLCTAVAILVVNLCACTWTRLLPRLKNVSRVNYWLLLLAHVLMILILLGHLSQMTMGFKEEGVKLLAGQSQTFPGDLRLTVEQVDFVNDPGILNLTYRQARRAHTRKAFNRTANMVRLALWRGPQRLAEGDLRILEPLLAGNIRLTLSDFFRDDSGGKSRVGAVLTVAYNPLTNFFFAAYLAWVAVYLLLAVKAFFRGEKPSINDLPSAPRGSQK
ncbi:MAG: hypothetical protein PHU44_11810 [Syntrophales bacterium]|nr:hypothetical protein [Syntrophales bacterium]MDD5640477.1 hypothetical protein [Syntrophales bacterium]